jgi:hypothetical protein
MILARMGRESQLISLINLASRDIIAIYISFVIVLDWIDLVSGGRLIFNLTCASPRINDCYM